MDIQQRCIDAYRRQKHLKRAADEVGIPWQTVYVHLRKAGEPVTGDKARYGSETDRLAARAEAIFQGLLPEAEDQNRRAFQSPVDFYVYGHGVDVKCARLRASNAKCNKKRWAFSVKKQEAVADFFVCLALDESDDPAHVLLVPGEIARYHSTIGLGQDGTGKWSDYLISADELREFFFQLEASEA